jgi:CTP:molybdopterin cytidylyltransferase MocA
VFTAIVLAAGDSTRMGTPKALLLTPEGQPFIVSILLAFAAAQVTDIIVVTGRDHEAIVEALSSDALPLTARVVRNPEPARGQLSSLWAAMDALPESADAMLVTLVDVPLIAPATIAAVIGAWGRTRAPIVRPAMGERHGHPVMFDRAVFAELRAASLDTGAKTVIRRHASDLINVPVTDERCLVDIDTPEDYRMLKTTGSGRT